MASSSPETFSWALSPVASFPRLRALLWVGKFLYASRGYELLRAEMGIGGIEWKNVANYDAPLWRKASSSVRITSRLFRDGFHALAKLSSGHIVAAVPGAVISVDPDEHKFRICHKVLRGTRPLHITAAPNDHIYWGEYFDNPMRDEVYVYASTDRGNTWEVAYAFQKGSIRHIHNIVYDRWQNCLWVLTGDNGSECRVVRASLDFKNVETILSGNQQVRAAAAIPTEEGLYFSSDTPLERNSIYRLDRKGQLDRLGELSGSSIYGCAIGNAIFFSTMVEPSIVNLDRAVRVYGSTDRIDWRSTLEWRKDRWPIRFFQYGNAILPDGENATKFLAVSTIAVRGADFVTSIFALRVR